MKFLRAIESARPEPHKGVNYVLCDKVRLQFWRTSGKNWDASLTKISAYIVLAGWVIWVDWFMESALSLCAASVDSKVVD